MNTKIIYRRTLKGLAGTIYDHQVFHSSRRNMPPPNYSRKDFIEWLLSQAKYSNLHKAWCDNNFNKSLTPSVDRKNDYLSYSFDNIQVMTWKENFDKGHRDRYNGVNNKLSKIVKQYTRKGNLVNIFYSIHKASRELGITAGEISEVCNGIRREARGFVFRFDNMDFSLAPKNIKRGKEKEQSKSVLMIGINSTHTFGSIGEASRITGISGSNICQVCKQNRKSAGGFSFKYARK